MALRHVMDVDYVTVTSYPADNVTYTLASGDELPTYTTMVVLSFIIGLFLLVSATGSTLTMAVIFTNKSLHTKANYFLFSLCLSDLISALFCSPLWLYRRTWGFHLWEWGNFWCKFYWVSDFATNYVTSLQIVSFAALRYTAVHRPFYVAKIRKRHILMYILLVWIVSIGTSVPLGIFMGVDLNKAERPQGSYWPSCSLISTPSCCVDQYDIYIYIVNSTLFYLPVVLITLLSLAIARTIIVKRRYRERHLSSIHLRTSQLRHDGDVIATSMTITSCSSLPDIVDGHDNGHVNKTFSLPSHGRVTATNSRGHGPVKQSSSRETVGHARLMKTNSREMASHHDLSTFTQLTLIVISFMIGYVPVTIYLLWSTATPEARKSSNDDYWFGTLSYVVLRFSECMNPVMYNLGSKTLRSASKTLVKKIFHCP